MLSLVVRLLGQHSGIEFFGLWRSPTRAYRVVHEVLRQMRNGDVVENEMLSIFDLFQLVENHRGVFGGASGG